MGTAILWVRKIPFNYISIRETFFFGFPSLSHSFDFVHLISKSVLTFKLLTCIHELINALCAFTRLLPCISRSAFFHAQIEQPVRGLMSLFNQQDEPVLVAINERGVFIIDHLNGVSVCACVCLCPML